MYDLLFNELMVLVDPAWLEGSTISSIGANGTDHHMTITKGTEEYIVIRRDDGKFTNWSRQETT